MDTKSTARLSVDNDRPTVEISPSSNTRKTYVTCDNRTCLATNVVLTSIASFLRDKVFPVVGEHCRINLHWDGIDLSTLHVQSVIPDNYVLVPRTTNSSSTSDVYGIECAAIPSFPYTIGRNSTTGCVPISAGSGPPATTHSVLNGTLATIKTENDAPCKGQLLGSDRLGPNSPVIVDGQPADNAKSLPEPRIIITRNGENNMSGTVSLLNPGKQLPSIRAKPAHHTTVMEQPSPLLLPTPPDMTPHSLCIPQTATHTQSIIPLVPVVTYIQHPQMTLGQMSSPQTALLQSAGVPISQVIHQVSSGPVYTTGQLIPSSLQAPQAYTVQPLTVSVPSTRPASQTQTQVRKPQQSLMSNGCRTGSGGIVKRIVQRGPAHQQQQQQTIKSEPTIIRPANSTAVPAATATRQIRVTPKRYHTPVVGSQILTKGGQVVLRSGGQISCKRPLEAQHADHRKVTLDNGTTAAATGTTTASNSCSSIQKRTKSPRLTKVSIVAHGQDDEPPVVYPALGSQPLETLFDTL